jgi:aspartate aminotransferase-like enzyme
MTIHSFNPPVRTLMGPGQADVHSWVLAALARPTIGHLDPALVVMMTAREGLLRDVFRTCKGMGHWVAGDDATEAARAVLDRDATAG